VNLVFSSKALKNCRPALEELMFFNPRQFRAREGIVNSLEKFGYPQLEETADGLSVRVGDCEAQTLFAFDPKQHSGNPVGVVVFLRTSPAEVAIMHLAVHPDYSLQGEHAGTGLGVVLVEKVKEIAARIVGIERVIFFYRREVVMRL
jgi:GNAT superfamily N-acetyltransferase